MFTVFGPLHGSWTVPLFASTAESVMSIWMPQYVCNKLVTVTSTMAMSHDHLADVCLICYDKLVPDCRMVVVFVHCQTGLMHLFNGWEKYKHPNFRLSPTGCCIGDQAHVGSILYGPATARGAKIKSTPKTHSTEQHRAHTTNHSPSRSANDPSRQSDSLRSKQPARRSTTLPTLSSTLHVWSNGPYLNQGSKLQCSRAALGMHVPKSEFHDLSEPVLGMQTNNWAEARACLRGLRHVPSSKDLHVGRSVEP